ncbi:MAG: hypothetical protein ACRECP_00340 [Methylocella sp.]
MRQANPIRFNHTAGQADDILQAEGLISGLPFDKLPADRGYVTPIAFPPHCKSRRRGRDPICPHPIAQAIPYAKQVYRERNLVERFFNKIRHFRRIVTRCEKTALSFASMLFLAGRRDPAPVNVNKT